MTAALHRPQTTGRHRAPESPDGPRLLTAADVRATWSRVGRHAALEPAGRHAALDVRGIACSDAHDAHPVDRLGSGTAAG